MLLEFGQSCRVLSTDVGYNKLAEYLEEELKKVNPAIKLVFDRKNPGEIKSEKPVFLQRFSSEWQQFVDVIDVIEIANNDRLKALPIKCPIGTSKV